MRNNWLAVAGGLDVVAALLHLGCIVGGPAWYRFFGAGEGMARLAERGAARPAVFAAAIAAMLLVWAAYAWSGAGLVPRLPLVRTGLVVISAIYLARALALPLMLRTMADRGTTFLVVSSAIVLGFGIVHAVGTWHAWPRSTGG